MQHNWLDIIVLCILVLLSALGIWSGLLKSLFRLFGWIAGIAGAWYCSEYIALVFTQNFISIPVYLARIAGLAIGFLVPFLVISLTGVLLHKLITASPLGGANRLGGGLLGFCKGLILCVLLLILLRWLPVQGTLLEIRDRSMAYSLFLWGEHRFLSFTER